MKRVKIPHTDSIEELARFWDTHDLTEFEDQLEEVTDLVFERKPETAITLHLQPQEVARAVLPIIEGVPDVIASSFDPGAVAVVRALAPSVPTAITIGRYADLDATLSLAIDAGHAEIHLPADHVDRAFVARAHDAVRAVLAYTVNDRVLARELEQIGIDGIFSDDPAHVRPT